MKIEDRRHKGAMRKIKCREAFKLRRSRKGSKEGEEGRRITSRILQSARENSLQACFKKHTLSLPVSLPLPLKSYMA